MGEYRRGGKKPKVSVLRLAGIGSMLPTRAGDTATAPAARCHALSVRCARLVAVAEAFAVPPNELFHRGELPSQRGVENGSVPFLRRNTMIVRHCQPPSAPASRKSAVGERRCSTHHVLRVSWDPDFVDEICNSLKLAGRRCQVKKRAAIFSLRGG